MITKQKKINLRFHNKFEIEVKNVITGEVRQKVQAYNVVCESLYTILCANQPYGSYIQYGSGTGTPSSSDTSLFHREGAVQRNSISINNNMNGLITVTSSVVLGTGTAVGVNLTEVGLAANEGNGYLTTHAMLQDMNGNPISIQKTDTDVITIYSTVYIHCTGANIECLSNFLDKSQSGYHYSSFGCNLAGKYWDRSSSVMYNYIYSPQHKRIVAYNADTSSVTTESFNFSFNSSLKTITLSHRVDVNAGNILGIDYLKIQSDVYFGQWEDEFIIHSPGGYQIQSESVGIGDGSTTQFKTKFSFPYSATVYVNGSPVQAQVKKETSYNNYNIIFSTAPSNGDVITIDYTTDYIAKDSDHVVDIALTLQFGDYQGQ